MRQCSVLFPRSINMKTKFMIIHFHRRVSEGAGWLVLQLLTRSAVLLLLYSVVPIIEINIQNKKALRSAEL